MFIFFFFKQKTAYEMRISDWSSDVCSSDLAFSAEPSRLRTGSHGVRLERAPPSRPAASAIAARRMPSSSICECPRHVREVERMLDHSPVSAIGHNVSPAFWDELQDRKSTRLNSSH